MENSLLKELIKQSKILIVDNSSLNLEALNINLKRLGISTITSNTGKQGIIIAKSKHPDIILLDNRLNDYDGFAFLESLRKNSKTNEIPVIFLLPKFDAKEITKIFNSGGSDYLIKPFNISEVCQKISFHIELNYLRKIVKENNISLQIKKQDKNSLNVKIASLAF